MYIVYQSRFAMLTLADIIKEATSAPLTPRDNRPFAASKDNGHSL